MKRVVLLLLLCSAVAWADLAPRSEITFVFQEIEGLEVVSAALLQAQSADGQVQPHGGQRLRLTGFGAYARSHGFARYNILELTLEDGRTLRSQVFSPTGLRSTHPVYAQKGQLVVEAGPSLPPLQEEEALSKSVRTKSSPRNILKFHFHEIQGQKVTAAALVTLFKDNPRPRPAPPNSRRRKVRPRDLQAGAHQQVLPLEVYGAKFLESRKSMTRLLSPRYELELTLADETKLRGRIPGWTSGRESVETGVFLYQVTVQEGDLLVELRTATNPAGVLVNTVFKFLL